MQSQRKTNTWTLTMKLKILEKGEKGFNGLFWMDCVGHGIVQYIFLRGGEIVSLNI